MIKKCVICGEGFPSPPSSKKITCSRECSLIRKSQSHMGKSNAWSGAALQRATERAAAMTPEERQRRGFVRWNIVWLKTAQPHVRKTTKDGLLLWMNRNRKRALSRLFFYFDKKYDAVSRQTIFLTIQPRINTACLVNKITTKPA